MITDTIYPLLLILHLSGMAIAAGITFANFIAYKQFWKLYSINKAQGVLSFRGINKFNLFGMLSLFLTILSGMGMLWMVDWVFVQLLWFEIKLTLVVLLFVNGFTMGRINNEKLANLISIKDDPNPLPDDVDTLKRNLQIFQGTQLILFLLIIILVVFKIN